MQCERAAAISAIGLMLIAGCTGGGSSGTTTPSAGGGGGGQLGSAPANAVDQPAPLPPPSTANLALCNCTSQATTFEVSGTQGTQAVVNSYTVPAYSYLWTTGWSTGINQILNVTAPNLNQQFVPFVTSQLVALFPA